VQAEVVVLLLAGLAPAAGTGAAGMAWLARLRFRRRIEVIRQDGVLAVIDGIIPPVPAVTGYLAALGVLAARARWPGIALATAQPGPAPGGLTPGQQQVMDDLSRRVRAAARSCLAWAGPAIVFWPRPPRPGDLVVTGTGGA
jgi:hypothetical protein